MKHIYSYYKKSRIHFLIILLPFLCAIGILFLLEEFGEQYFNFTDIQNMHSTLYIFEATAYTVGRILIAFVFSIITAVTLAVVVTRNTLLEKIFIPIFDVLESVPILAFFPIIISVFVSMNWNNGAAIFIIYITMLWSILFSVASGIKLIPEEIKEASQVFGITGFKYFRYVLFPAVIPELITGSILAFAGAWNIIIVAEVLHVYIPDADNSSDLFGLGSLLVHSTATGDKQVFFLALLLMIFLIAIINIFIWQKLLTFAEKYKFE